MGIDGHMEMNALPLHTYMHAQTHTLPPHPAIKCPSSDDSADGPPNKNGKTNY